MSGEQLVGRADTIAANLMQPLLLRVAEMRVVQPKTLIVSGLLEEELGETAGAFAPLREKRRLVERGWGAVLHAESGR